MANRQPDAAGLLAFLWDHFDADTASDEDLEYLSVATEEAANAAFRLSTVISGISCLIGDDRGIHDTPECGALQDATQSTLLHHIADEVEAIARLAHIGAESEGRLRFRLKERLATNSSRRIKHDLQSSSQREAA
ncbi:hypothetical protein CJO71_30160 [Burkholderia ubonensis]|uniref:Uncharacterized protein n=1 Tax=Burkholderia ubonensis TaxID=101571 RepID=A0AB74DD67_9BURK|nr:hypothetical protein [Burkholderia ubonensis]PAJ77312.1 hypothetical protein CJO71_30160 [Burkholderia ubonensis]RQP79189.1 hypothetical protein DF015_12340 [Burkholderia ubonensis]